MTRARSPVTGVTEPGLVTIAIPTANGSRWLSEAIASALGQTYARTEILVVDDASDDDSAEIAASTGDDRVRVVRNERRLGLAGNWNRCIAEARGEYLKFVFQDDLLHPACVEELVALMRESPSVGLAFTPRRIELDEPDDPAARRWASRFGQVHRGFGSLERVNLGRDLFDRQMSRSPFRNWIGEPSVVLLRTDLVRALGGFNERLHQLVDAEMWLRLMFHADIGFIDRPLATFRVHRASATTRHASSGVNWLDALWMVEGLLGDDEISAERPRIAGLRARALAHVVRGELGRIALRRTPALLSRRSDLRDYVRRGAAVRPATPALKPQPVRVDVRPDTSTVAAVIVTHHPQPGLAERIRHLAAQVDAIIVVDNASAPGEVEEILGPVRSVAAETILNPVNVGLATALNQGVGWATERGYAWALTLDQDTIPGPDLVAEAARVFDAFRAHCPAVIGARYHADPIAPSPGLAPGRLTPVVITAGALHSVPAWQAVGGFRDDFFIDSVDTEYCLRARSMRYSVLIADTPTMTHSIGRPTRHRNAFRSFSTSNHDRSRRYYITRNRVMTWRRYARREPRYVLYEMRGTAKDLIKLVLVEDDRRGKLAAVARGAFDGLRGVGGEMPR